MNDFQRNASFLQDIVDDIGSQLEIFEANVTAPNAQRRLDTVVGWIVAAIGVVAVAVVDKVLRENIVQEASYQSFQHDDGDDTCILAFMQLTWAKNQSIKSSKVQYFILYGGWL